MPRLQRRNFTNPENIRTFQNQTVKTISLDEVVVGEFVMQPGWRWSQHVKPLVGTPSCQHHHIGYVLAGRLHIDMTDGTSLEIGPGDVYEIAPGHDAWVVGDETYHGVEFTGARTFGVTPDELGNGIVATLLFTDIVGSTAKLAELGDVRWREAIVQHNALMRRELDRFRGRELATTGDGFLAAFDSAARAVRCGGAMAKAAAGSGLPIRVGCHTGEFEVHGGEARGMAVHTAARVMSLAGAGEVFASWTTRDLLAGSGIETASAGSHELKGVPGPRELFRIVP